MLPIAYNIQLRAPKENSPEWYKKFHNRHYLFTLSNLLLLSYIRTCVFHLHNMDNEEIIAQDIKNFLEELILREVKNQDTTTKFLLLGMGICIEDEENEKSKEININLNDLLALTYRKNWYEVIKGLLNSWEFLCLYANIETALKEVLDLEGTLKEESLISELFVKYPNLEQKLQEESNFYSKTICEDTWKFYTRVRNIYAHSFGFITSKARDSILGGLRENFIKSWEKIKENELLLFSLLEEPIKSSFSKTSMREGKIYLLSDVELDIFRNFSIHLAESLEEITRT